MLPAEKQNYLGQSSISLIIYLSCTFVSELTYFYLAWCCPVIYYNVNMTRWKPSYPGWTRKLKRRKRVWRASKRIRNGFGNKISLLANLYFPLSSLCRYVSFLVSLNFIRLRIISSHLPVYLCQIGVVQCNFDIEMLVESTAVGRMKGWE